MINYSENKKISGFGLIEILVAISIIGLTLSTLAGLGNFSLKIQNRLQKNTAASYLAAEGIEATRAIKDEDWTIISGLSVDSALHPTQSGSPAKWSLNSSAETINGFSRQVILANVYRDSNDDIITSGGTLDPNTKKVTSTISWSDQGQSQQVSLSTYITNWKPVE